jgi:hypothetical protein
MAGLGINQIAPWNMRNDLVFYNKPLCFVTLVKASLLQSTCLGCSRETQDPGLPDRTMVSAIGVAFPPKGIVLEEHLRRHELEQCYIYRINDDMSRRAAGSQQRA